MSVSLTRFAWLSIAAAVGTIALKLLAWWLTGSVGLLSDALESVVNLVAAAMTLAMLSVAAKPPDELHAFGHGKAEYFASGVEGALILLAAVGIGWTALQRLLAPAPIEQAWLGLGVSTAASAINFGVARVLLRASEQHRSIALEADAHHLMTDVWTSGGVLIGIVAVVLTGWQRLDPLIAIGVALNIVWSGVRIIRGSVLGLMDGALPPHEQQAVASVLQKLAPPVQCHAVRTRQAGATRFISLHVLVPGEWSVRRGHDLLEELEGALCAAVPGATVFTHIEPLEDPASFADLELDRVAGESSSARP
jgi:cation diffusion facilitator family transporter